MNDGALEFVDPPTFVVDSSSNVFLRIHNSDCHEGGIWHIYITACLKEDPDDCITTSEEHPAYYHVHDTNEYGEYGAFGDNKGSHNGYGLYTGYGYGGDANHGGHYDAEHDDYGHGPHLSFYEQHHKL
jgi:hypothetical protein